MLTWIIVLVVGAIVIGLLKYLLEEHGVAVGLIIVLIIVFSLFGWIGVLAAIAIAAVVVGIVCLVQFIGKTVEEHDKQKKETAKINFATQIKKEAFENETALLEELNLNCRWLGYMNDEMWQRKFPNYMDKKYATDFKEITANFAKQTEQQYITQNNEWFQPFLRYIIEHPQGSTPTKMINEVNCPQFNATHFTPNIVLLKKKLKEGTQRVSKDVPPLFEEIPLSEIADCLYVPTKYALKLYGKEEKEFGVKQEEISFSDL